MPPTENHTHPTSATRKNYSPYADPGAARAWLEAVLDQLGVERVTALHHVCTSEWAMAPRRVGDDMFFYVTAGSGWAEIEGRRIALAAGTCAHFRRGVPHAAGHDPRRPLRVVALHYTARLFDSLTAPQALGFPDAFDLRGDRVADTLFREACREHVLRPPGHTRAVEAIVLRLLLHLVRTHGQALALPGQRPKVGDLGRLFPALDAMQRRHAEPVTVAAYARCAGLSEPQFRRVFGRAMGLSPVRHLARLRMERACWLLRHTSRTIEAIADDVGYAEPAFFARLFRREMKASPGAYRLLRGP